MTELTPENEPLSKEQEATLALLQDLVGLSGLKWKGIQEDGAALCSLLPINIGQRFQVRPYDVLVAPNGVPGVADD